MIVSYSVILGEDFKLYTLIPRPPEMNLYKSFVIDGSTVVNPKYVEYYR